MVKNCDLGLENAALGLRPQAVFSRPRSQFFPIRTSQPANNIYVWYVRNVSSLFFNIRISISIYCYYDFIFLYSRTYEEGKTVYDVSYS